MKPLTKNQKEKLRLFNLASKMAKEELQKEEKNKVNKMEKKKTTYMTKEDLPQIKLPLSRQDYERLRESWKDGDLLLSDFSDELSKDFRMFEQERQNKEENRKRESGLWLPFE